MEEKEVWKPCMVALNELALFAGAGGGILGGKLLGWKTVCAVENGAYPASVLCTRQNDGLLDPFPIWDDVCTFDGKPWRGIVDVVSGGFPCQDISVAGNGEGITGERSGLWVEMARIIGEVRPRYAFVENSPVLTSRGLGVVLGDLAAMGFDARYGVLGAADVGAPHLRERIWIVADSQSPRQQENVGIRERQEKPMFSGNGDLAHAKKLYIDAGDNHRKHGQGEIPEPGNRCGSQRGCGWWQSEPDVGRVVNGMAARVDRLKAIGNGQVPQCAAEAWRVLTQ